LSTPETASELIMVMWNL